MDEDESAIGASLEGRAGVAVDAADGAALARRLLPMLARVTDGIIALDHEWRVVYVNGRAGELLALDPDMLVGRVVWDVVPLPADDAVRPTFELAMTTQRPVTFDHFYEPTRHWCEVRAYPSPDGLSVLLVNVTERRHAEDVLREHEARFRSVASAGSTMLFDFDLASGTIWREGGLLASLGYPPDANAASLEWWMERIHPEDRPASDASLVARRDDVVRRDEESISYRFQRADGSYVALTGRSRLMRDSDGRPCRILGVLVDTADRREIEDALRESEALFRTLAESAPVGIFRSDLRGGATYVNERLTQIVDLPASEMTERGWSSRVHRDDAALLWERWHSALRTATEFEHEYRLQLPDAVVRWVRVQAVPLLDATGVATGMVGTVIDLTERRRLEQQLLHSQKLDAIGQLSGGVAHDFNNLLTVIQANVELVQSTAGPDVQVELAEVAAATARAAQLTRQLLAFSRRQVLQPTALDLNEVVLDAERLLHRLLGERIVVESALAPALWRVRADAGQMEQVLMNLAVNARDAMTVDGGTLTIATANVPAAASGTGRDCVRLTVRDTGVGMSPEVRDHVFEPFFTTKAPGVGTGLGLAMVYGIVTQSDGTVHVESTPGGGSEFSLLLPRAESSAQPATAGAPRPVLVGGNERILLVEDEAAVRGVARRILERAGYTVLEARHGADALLVWREHAGAVDLLLTDVRMPEMGGLELVAALRAERPTLPVVVMSGYSDVGAPGNTEWFLEKPFSREALLRCVRKALDGERPAAEG